MNSDSIDADLTDRASFRHWTPVSIRFSDQDPLGHVNNVASAAYVEACRTMLIDRFLLRDKYRDLNYVLVHMEIDFLAEFRYPGTVEVGGRVEKVGTKSFTTGYGLFVGERCVATARCVNVFFDLAKRSAVAPPGEVRALLENANTSS